LRELKSSKSHILSQVIATSTQGGIEPTRLLYYEDSYLKEFRAKVLAVQQLDKEWRIVLDQTAFYPMGGGQPSDKGRIKGLNGDAIVKDVRIEHQLVVHFADEITGKLGQGEEVLGILDWNLRYSLMRNHTLAHLMAEAIRRATGLTEEVVSSGLDVDKARLDTAREGSLGPMIPDIQEIANNVIKENRPVEVKMMPRKEAEERVARFHESLKTLPSHVEKVRVIEIKEWHACACGGTHVKSTGEIGGAEVLKRMSKGKGVERIEFRAKTS